MTPLALPPSADRLESMCRRPPQHGEQVQQHLFAVEIDRFPAVEQATELFPVLCPAVRRLPVRQSASQRGFARENLGDRKMVQRVTGGADWVATGWSAEIRKKHKSH